MAGFDAGDPMDLDHQTEESAEAPISISDSIQDVTMLDVDIDPQMSSDKSPRPDKNISSETSPAQEGQQVSQPNAAERSHLSQQLGVVADENQAQEVVWQDTHGVQSRENYQYSVIQTQHQLLQAQLRNGSAPSVAPSVTVHQATPQMKVWSLDSRTDDRPTFMGNETPRLPIPKSLGVGPNAVVARSSALDQNLLYSQQPHHDSSAPFILPTGGARVHPYPIDPTSALPRRSTVSHADAPSSRAAAVEEVLERAKVKLRPLRLSAYPEYNTVPKRPFAPSSIRLPPISDILAGSSTVRHNPAAPLAGTSTGASPSADQIHSSSPFTSDSGATASVVKTSAFQKPPPPPAITSNPQPLPPTEQQPAVNRRVVSGRQQPKDGAPTDQTFNYSPPVPVLAPTLITQAHLGHIPGAIAASDRTSVAESDQSANSKSPSVTKSSSVSAPASRFFPIPTSSSNTPVSRFFPLPTSSSNTPVSRFFPSQTSSSNTPLDAPSSSVPATAGPDRIFTNWTPINSQTTPVGPQSSMQPRQPQTLQEAPVIDRTSYGRAMTSVQLPPLPQFGAPMFAQLPPNVGSAAPAAAGLSVPADELALRLAALARDEGFDQPPRLRSTRWNPNDKSKWVPEYLRPLYAPAGSDPARDGSLLRLFYNHTRTNGQYWPLSKAAPHAKSGEPIYVAGLYGGTAGAANNALNQGAWTAVEDQILFDGTLRGDGWAGLSPLFTIHSRSADQINDRINALKGANGPLPFCWTHTHQEAQIELRNTRHCGEKELEEKEQAELARWVYNGYQGIRPAVFHSSRCTERLRKELRAMQDMDTECLMLAGRYFDRRLR